VAVRGWVNPVEGINLRRPTGGVRVLTPPRPQQAPVQPVKPKTQPKQQVPLTTDEMIALSRKNGVASGVASTPAQGEAEGENDGSWWQKGLGAVLNNPVTKAALVPLNMLDIARRAVVLGTEEAAKLLPEPIEFLGTPFAPFVDEDRANADTRSNWEKLNPWDDEGASYGFGEIAKSTGNNWADRGIGFLGDVVMDPLTYVGGLGVANKVAKTGTGLTDDAIRAMTKLDDASDAARTSRAGTAGRMNRMNRVAEAERFLNRTGLSDEDLTKALAELQDVAGRGLGTARTPIVKEALNIEGPALRVRLPFSKTAGAAVPGTRAIGQKIADTTGNARQALNMAGKDQGLVAARTGIDYEGAVKALTQGSKLDPESFSKAAETVRLLERKRPLTGRYLNLGQRAANEVRGNIRSEMSKFDTPAEYLHMIETGDPEVLRRLNLPDGAWDQVAGRDIFEYLGFRMPEQELGVTATRIGGLNYVPHETSQDFVNWINSGDTNAKAFAAMLEDRFGGTEISLLTDSGRSQARQIGPDMELLVGDRVARTGAGTIRDLNQAMWDLGFPAKKKAYVDDPMELVENYVQNMGEDLGRQAARAEMVADGSRWFAPTPEFIGSPAEDAAQRRLAQTGRTGIPTPETVGARTTQFADQGEEVSAPLGSETMLAEPTAQSQQAARQAIIDGEPLGAEYDREINELIAAYGDIDNVPFVRLEKAAKKLTNLQKEIDDLVARVGDQAGNEEFARMVDAVIGNFKLLSGDTMIDRQIEQYLTNMGRQIRNPNMLARALQKATTFFKTYAILTPGFHIRNGLSAIFMNSADGVSLKATGDGFDWWTKFEHAAKDGDGGMAWLAKQDETVRNAFDAVFASGAGGRYKEAGIAEAGSALSKVGKRLIENPATRFSQRVGARVEGPVRLGMAFDTVRNGGSVQDAVARITRVHFDYSQASRFDEQMKRIVPFWTFMSRNLPLQVQQMWTRPARYAQYNSLVRNMQGEDAEGMPQYIKDRGGFMLPSPVNVPFFGNINAIDPDLAHLRLEEDIARYGDVFKNPGQILSDANPWITAPIEIATRKNLYTGAEIGKDEFEHVSNPLEMAMAAALAPFGAVKRSPDTGAWGIDQAWVGGLQSTVPLVDRATRLTGSGPTGSDRMGETMLRFLGIPGEKHHRAADAEYDAVAVLQSARSQRSAAGSLPDDPRRVIP
jgi:hypothetical protein